VTTVLYPDLVDEIGRPGDFDAIECMNCGVCTAVCPMGIDVLPRRLFHQVTLGMRDALLAEIETVYSCLLCGVCEENCPAGVHIAENVRSLRRYLNHTLFGL
jgi:heterodisulfide reductase subunit C